jgi:glutamine synthetase
MPQSKEELLKKIQEKKVRFIDLQFTDVVGIVKSVTIPVRELKVALEHGIWFDGSSIGGFARIAESDMYLSPDPDTFAILPWTEGENKTARLICSVFNPNGKKYIGDPRSVLERVLAEAEEMGFSYNTGPELEFFIFKPNGDGMPTAPVPHDQAGYFDVSNDQARQIKLWMSSALEAFGIEVEAAHHEVAMGQHEIDFKYDNALRTADNAVTFRVVLKAVAQLNGLYATFMPKPIGGINGSGMHTHQSLTYKDSGKNAFADPDDEYGLSKIAKHFIAGQLAHAKGMCAVIAPLVNSYKRLVPGYEAPVYISWARINRSALIRVPHIRREQIEATRMELRCPDPSCNPYLAFAAMLAAGLDGIKKELPVPEPTEEDLYHLEPGHPPLDTLPGSLGEALQELEKDEVIQEALGPHVYKWFMDAKRLEWDEYRLQISQWELDRYLPIY